MEVGMRKSLKKLVIFFSMPCWIIGGYLPTQGFWYDWIGSKKDVLAASNSMAIFLFGRQM